jgi:hypothetical protein
MTFVRRLLQFPVGILLQTKSMRSIFLLLFGVACAAAAQSSYSQATPWQMEQSGTTADLRGVHATGGGVVWASGTGGTVLRSEDSGFEWQSCAMPPGAEALDFRAIWAWDANTAMVMSSGTGDLSRLYKTTDGCAHWTLLYTNPDKDGFWDALQFIDRQNGYILGDPVGGSLTLLRTEDGGTHWTRTEFPKLPPGPPRSGTGRSTPEQHQGRRLRIVGSDWRARWRAPVPHPERLQGRDRCGQQGRAAQLPQYQGRSRADPAVARRERICRHFFRAGDLAG